MVKVTGITCAVAKKIRKMRNFQARIKKLESKHKNPKKLYKFYWADGTFLGSFYA